MILSSILKNVHKGGKIMLYMSNDRKGVFETEQECLEYEQNVEQERIKKEKLEMERQNRLNSISKKYEDLQKEIAKYKSDYGVKQMPYFAPIYELMSMLHM